MNQSAGTETEQDVDTDSEFARCISSGGDERLDLDDDCANKYFIRPHHYADVFNRGSCTCNPFTEDGYQAARQLYDRMYEQDFDTLVDAHADTLKRLINYEGHDRFDVFFAPSGSDLCYYPLLFSKLIHPDRKMMNLITCPEEIGSGSMLAYEGRYFHEHSQFGSGGSKGDMLSDEIDVETRLFSARSDQGEIINHRDEILQTIHDHYHDYSVIANLVVGSKSGIENPINIVSETPEDVTWVIDLCQFRASRGLINGLIGMNCMVMITGSKFYQSPPFCGALLVPRTISDRFLDADASFAEHFRSVFSKYDIPQRFENIRAQLDDYKNYGLLLRWEAALNEIVKLEAIDSYTINMSITKWNEAVVDKLNVSPCFEMIPGFEVTNRSIISFRVRGSDGNFLSHQQLKALHEKLSVTEYEGLDGCSRVLIGQPVQYGDKSFIRVALGSYNLRRLLENDFDMSNDLRLIDIIEETASEYP